MLLGPAVMVDREEDAAAGPVPVTQIQGRQSAVTADFKTRTRPAGLKRRLAKAAAFLGIEKSLGLCYQIWVNVHRQ
jgi:hypothetical protein